MIRVQHQAFDAGFELMAIKSGKTGVGATALFVGSVRDLGGSDAAGVGGTRWGGGRGVRR